MWVGTQPPVDNELPKGEPVNRADLRQARGVLPYKSKDPVLPNPDATGQFVFITLRPDLDEARAREFLHTLQKATQRSRRPRVMGTGSRQLRPASRRRSSPARRLPGYLAFPG